MFKESISKEELTELPLRWFEGKIEIIDSLKSVDRAVEQMWGHKVIGFDTETKPAFKKGVVNKVALLQLSTREKAFLFRINKIGLPASLSALLSDPGVIKPGVAIRDDIKGLQEWKAFEPRGFIELQDHAKDLGIQNFSLKKLTGIACGFRISKGAQLTNWEAAKLTEKQQIYAATDAWTALEIYEQFSNYI